MDHQLNKGLNQTCLWSVVNQVWLGIKSILTTGSSIKPDGIRLEPFFSIPQCTSALNFKLTLPLSMKGVHPAFHLSRINKHKPYLGMEIGLSNQEVIESHVRG